MKGRFRWVVPVCLPSDVACDPPNVGCVASSGDCADVYIDAASEPCPTHGNAQTLCEIPLLPDGDDSP